MNKTCSICMNAKTDQLLCRKHLRYKDALDHCDDWINRSGPEGTDVSKAVAAQAAIAAGEGATALGYATSHPDVEQGNAVFRETRVHVSALFHHLAENPELLTDWADANDVPLYHVSDLMKEIAHRMENPR